MRAKTKNRSFLSLLVLSLLFIGLKADRSAVQEEGISFSHVKFKEALALAKEQDKLIFIDGYTTWCGPCKLMARTVFKDKGVGEYYNEHFINLKIDMETSEGIFVSNKYQVTGYPTFLYLKPDGTLVKKAMGATKADRFIGYGKSAVSDGT